MAEDESSSLRQKAARYRDLANIASDHYTRQQLLEIAFEFDQLADQENSITAIPRDPTC